MSRVTVELLPPKALGGRGRGKGHPQQIGAVGRLLVEVSLHANAGSLLAASGVGQEQGPRPLPRQLPQEEDFCKIHLRVWLGRVCLTSGNLRGMRAVFKLGPTQEVSVQ